MPLPSQIEALRNQRTGKLFIILDPDVGSGKAKVINPAGEVLDVATVIFDIDGPVTITSAQYAESFAQAQLVKLENWESQIRAVDEKRRLERAARTSQARPQDAAKRRSSRTDGLIAKSQGTRRPIASWSSDNLVFYRHKIEPLKTNDVFAVHIENVGIFQITKSEFLRVFNHVVMDQQYRTNGIYKFREFPDEAKSYLQS
jgi:hypothetical protein